MKGRIKGVILLVIAGFILAACGNNTAHVPSQANQVQATSAETAAQGKAAPVVEIDGKMYDRDDLDFFILMEKIKIERNRAADNQQLKGEERADKMDYWDDQLQQYDNLNIGLQGMIEINAMALLAEEKNYFVPEEKLEKKVAAFSKEVEGNEAMEALIADYGEKSYHRKLRDYISVSTLRDRVAADLEKEIMEENPDSSAIEQNFLLNDKFEELYIDQVASLEIEIKLK